MTIKIENMWNKNRAIPNQFNIEGPEFYAFQSYDKIIVKKQNGQYLLVDLNKGE